LSEETVALSALLIVEFSARVAFSVKVEFSARVEFSVRLALIDVLLFSSSSVELSYSSSPVDRLRR